MGKTRPLYEKLPNIRTEPGDEYAVMLEGFILKLGDELNFLDAVERYSMLAGVWNYANLYGVVPEKALDKMMPDELLSRFGKEKLMKFVHMKRELYPDADQYFQDIWFEELGDGLVLKVETTDADSFLEEPDDDIDLDLMDELSGLMEEDNDLNEPGYINRSAIIVKYKPTFINWLVKQGHLSSDQDYSSSFMTKLYLVDDFISPAEWIKQGHPFIFESELFEWTTNRKSWPRKRNYEKFKEWFEVQFFEDVLDIGVMPIS